MEVQRDIIFILGAPCSGKTTQCEMLEQTYGFTHISMNNLLDIECAKSDSEFSETIKRCKQNWRVVPCVISVQLLEKAIYLSPKTRFVVEGFPGNCETWTYWCNRAGDRVNTPHLIFIDTSEDVCITRSKGLGPGSSLAAGPSGPGIHNSELRKRFLCFITQTLEMITTLGQQGKIHKINGNKTILQVFSEVSADFKRTFPYLTQ